MIPKIGQKFILQRKFSEIDVKNFALLSGDMNPIHLDEEAGFLILIKSKYLI